MKKILVIVDMQNDFITGPLGNADCQAVVNNIIEIVNNEKYTDIILTRDTHQENYLDTREGKNLPVIHCIEGTEGFEIDSDIMSAVENKYKTSEIRNYLNQKENMPIIINKPSFGSMELARLLSENVNAEDIIDFVGVCTGICVISNVLLAKAAVSETKVRVIENACACVTKESHRTAIEAMKMCQVEIVWNRRIL